MGMVLMLVVLMVAVVVVMIVKMVVVFTLYFSSLLLVHFFSFTSSLAIHLAVFSSFPPSVVFYHLQASFFSIKFKRKGEETVEEGEKTRVFIYAAILPLFLYL